GRAALAALVLDPAQYMDRRVLRAADMAGAAAMRAGDKAGFRQRRTQSLPAHFHQAEMTYMAHLDTGAVVLERLLQATLHHCVVALRLHVDEVDDDQAGQVTQPQLARRLVSGFQIGAERRFLDVALAGGAPGIDVD